MNQLDLKDIQDLLIILDQATIRGSQASRILQLRNKLQSVASSLVSSEREGSDRSCNTDVSVP